MFYSNDTLSMLSFICLTIRKAFRFHFWRHIHALRHSVSQCLRQCDPRNDVIRFLRHSLALLALIWQIFSSQCCQFYSSQYAPFCVTVTSFSSLGDKISTSQRDSLLHQCNLFFVTVWLNTTISHKVWRHKWKVFIPKSMCVPFARSPWTNLKEKDGPMEQRTLKKCK